MTELTDLPIKLSLDQQGLFLHLPEEWQARTGFLEKDTLGQAFYYFLHPIDRPGFNNWIINNQNGQKKYLQVVRYVDTTMDWKWAELKVEGDFANRQFQIELRPLLQSNDASQKIRLTQLERMQDSWRRISQPIDLESPNEKIVGLLTRLKDVLEVERAILFKGEEISFIGQAGIDDISKAQFWSGEKESLSTLYTEGHLSQVALTQKTAPIAYADLAPKIDLHYLFASANIGDPALETSVHVACRQSIRPPFDETEMQLIQWTGERIIGLLHQKSEKELEKLALFDELVTRISAKFVNLEPEEIPAQIEQSLALLGTHTKVERAYIFQLNNDKDTLLRVYEWGYQNFPTLEEFSKDLPQEKFSWLLKRLRTSESVHIQSLDQMPKEAELEKEMLAKQGVKSLLLVPMIKNGVLEGFLGLSSISENRFSSAREIRLLRLVGDLMVQVIQKQNQYFQLRNFERRVKALASTVFDAVVTINQNGFVLEWNDKAEEMFGYKHKEALGQRMSDLIVPDMYRQAHERGMEKFRKTGEGPVLGSRIEIIAMNKAKEVFPIELAITPINLGDRYIFTGYLRDISYRKEAEQKREKLLSELEKANQELKDFAYIVSHDLKAPLRAIGSLTDWLYEDYRDQLDEDGQEQMGLLQDRVRRMYRLIEGILAYSRLGRTAENREEVDFNEVLEDVKLGLEIPPNFDILLKDKLPTLIWDRTRAFQVFQNLISNAIKYNDKEKAWIEITCLDHRTHFRIDFKDNGKGIDSRYFRKIFQIFQTLQPRDEFESTGIGLTLVKKIVEMHGGTIGVESIPGEGTTFSIKLKKPETDK